jgi:hypothetical protein
MGCRWGSTWNATAVEEEAMSRSDPTVPMNGIHDLAVALARCVNGLVGGRSSGFGGFTVNATREQNGRIRIHVDGGIFSRVVYVDGDGVRVRVLGNKNEEGTWLALEPQRLEALDD